MRRVVSKHQKRNRLNQGIMYEKGCLRTPKPSSKYIRLQVARNINKMNEVQKHVIVKYTPDQEGQDIEDKDVVRPMNHRWCFKGGEETSTWKVNSWARYPTYGSCEFCKKSGPVGKTCNECPILEIEPRYVILIDRNKILDSITLAQMLNQGHETAKADRMYHPRMNKIKPFSTEHIGFGVDLWFFDEQDPLVKAELLLEIELEI
jgi:hypothetical protein